MSFREKLFSDDFTVTGEVTPLKGTSKEKIRSTLNHLRGVVDAVNVTDNQRSCVKASSLAASKIILDNGFEPILQLTCRDRNRIALQSDLLGAHMLGMHNVLALTGDHPSIGDHPTAKQVYDLDSTQLIETINGLNNGVDLMGNPLDEKTNFLIGAALDTATDDVEVEVLRVKRKMDAGAQFFQTQVVYDIDNFKDIMNEMPSNLRVLAGIIPLKSARMAKFMNDKMPGVKVPKAMIQQLDESNDPIKTGIIQAAEVVKGIRPHCKGVHIMSMGLEQHVKTMLEEAGV